MFVDKSMTRKVITIEKEAGIFTAQALMAEHKVRHIPVVAENGTLIGMVTDRDVRSALPYAMYWDTGDAEERERIRKDLAKLTVADIMSSDLVKVSPLDTIQDALLLVQRTKVGALPVVDERNRLLGIISVRDLLRTFINVLGIGEPGSLMGIMVPEEVGQLKKIVDAITEENVSFGSILVARSWDKDKRAVFIYLLTQNVRGIKRKLKKMGYSLLDPMEWYLDELPEED
jgi:acetoin utilization protein AcuB